MGNPDKLDFEWCLNICFLLLSVLSYFDNKVFLPFARTNILLFDNHIFITEGVKLLLMDI